MLFSAELATDRLIDQFNRGNDLIPTIVASGTPKIEAITDVTAIVATTFFRDARTRGDEAQGLSVWHQNLRSRCRTTFQELSQNYPDLEKEDVNAIDELLVLNGIRRGIKKAMSNSYSLAKPSK